MIELLAQAKLRTTNGDEVNIPTISADNVFANGLQIFLVWPAPLLS